MTQTPENQTHETQSADPSAAARDAATSRLERRLTLMCIAMVLLGLVLVFQLPNHISAMENQVEYNNEFKEFAELFSEIYGVIQESYVEPVDSKILFEGAIQGMFMTLDPHSSYLPPVAQEMMTKDTEGEYSGVGLHITLRDRILTVISPIEGSPAGAAGVQPWDRIIEIDGESTKDITLIEAVQKLTGPTGTKVKIKVWRQGEELEFEVTRKTIKVQSVFHKILDDKIGYLRLTKFQDDTANEVRTALESFNEAEVEGVILDLRYNAGGLLDRAVEICDFFMPKGQLIVSIKGRIEKQNREFVAEGTQLCKQPVLVLVNNGSASASEIVAGALKDTRRGVILGPKGEKTFGKGSVQTLRQLQNSLEMDDNGLRRSSGMRLTTAKYYTPSGVSIHDVGIEPDIGVELPEGHARDLQVHGLLGDPDMVEPGEEPVPGEDGATPTDETPVDEAPAGEDNDPDSLRNQLNGAGAEGTSGPQRTDILLEEGIKYMKAILIFRGHEAA